MNSKGPTSSSNAPLEITQVFSLADSITINDDPQSPPASKIQKNTKEKTEHLIPTNVPLQSEHRGVVSRNSDDPYFHAADDPVICQTTSTAVPNASTALPVTCSSVPKISVPEVIDVDEEDLDDCKLVKVDLSQRKFPFAKKFQNTEVICLADDSDEGETEASACHASKSKRKKRGNRAPVVTSTDIYIDRSESPELDMEVDVIKENVSYTYPAELPTLEMETDVIKENISEPSKSQALEKDLVKHNTCIDNVVDSRSTENHTNLVSNSIPTVILAEKTFPHGNASHGVISSSSTLVNDADNVNPVIPIALHVISAVADKTTAVSDVTVGGFSSLQSLPVNLFNIVGMRCVENSDSQHPLKLSSSQTSAAKKQKISNLPQENATEKSGARLLFCKICSLAFENRLALVEHTVTRHKPKQDAVIKPELSHDEHTVCSHKPSQFPVLRTQLMKRDNLKSISNGLKNTSLPPLTTASGLENASHPNIVGDNLITARPSPENLTTTLPKKNVHPVKCHKENEPENSYNSSGQTEGSKTHNKSLTGPGLTEGPSTSKTHNKSLTGPDLTEGPNTSKTIQDKALTGPGLTEGPSTSKTHNKSLTGKGQIEGPSTSKKIQDKSLTGIGLTEGPNTSKIHNKSLPSTGQIEDHSSSKTIQDKSLTGTGQADSCIKTTPDILQEDIKINCPSCHYPFGTIAERNEHLIQEKKCAHVLSSFCTCCSLHLSSAAEKERHLLNFDDCMVKDLLLKTKINEKIESPSLRKNAPVEKSQPVTERRSSNQQALPVSSGLTAHPPQKKPPAIKIAFRRCVKLPKPRSGIAVEKSISPKSKNTITSASGLVCQLCDKKFVSPIELGIHTSNKACQQAIHTKQPEACKVKKLKIVLQHVSVMCKVCKKTFKDNLEFSKHQDISEACKQKECVESEVLGSTYPKNCLPNSSSSLPCAEQGAVSAPPPVESDLEFSSDEEESSNSSSSEAGTVEYKCKICSNLFSHKSSFKKHVKTHNPNFVQKKQAKKMRCKCCTRKFTDDTALQAHLLKRRFCFLNVTKAYTSNSGDVLNCGMCGKVYPTAKDLRKHGFRDMTCRLRLVDLVLKEYKAKSGTQLPAIPSSSTEQVLPDTTVSSSSKDPPAVQCDNITSDLPTAPHTLSSNPLADQHTTSSNSPVAEHTTPSNSPVTVSCDPPAIQHNTISSDLNVLDKKQETSSGTSNPVNEISNRNVCKSCGKSFLILNFRYHLLSSRACYKYYDEHRTECPKHLTFCFECKRGFKSPKDLSSHTCVKCDFSCSICGQGFKLKAHLRMHLAKFAFCRQALDKAAVERTAQRSLKSASSDSTTVASTLPGLKAASPGSVVADTYTCLLCKVEFPNHKELLEHSYQHTEEKPYECSRCSVTFFHFNRLVSHDGFHRRMDKEARLSAEATHKDSALTDVKPAIIKQDPSKPEGASRDLTKPVENSYNCLVCQESFNTFHQFKVHIRKHSRTSFYSCSICLKKFATQDALNHHFKQHEQPRTGVKRKSTPVVQSHREVEQSGSAVEQPVSAVEQPVSAVEQPVSAVEQPVSAVEQPVSAVEQPSAIEMPASATEWNCTVCAEPFHSPTQKGKHLAASVLCNKGKSLKLTSSLYGCLYCQHYFPSDQDKRRHMIESKACRDQMKNTFDNKLYTCANRDIGQNSKLCVFCGGHFANMFAHLLDSTCFPRLEQSVIDHRKLEKLGVKAETYADVAKPAGSLPAFPCRVCKRSFEKESFLKQHVKKHMSMFKNEVIDIEADIAFDEHLYCHVCLKYLKTVNFVKQHVLLGHCTKPISRSVYQNVVCKAGAYWCNICDIKYESGKYDDLITHMYENHNEGTSRLLSVFNSSSAILKAELKKSARKSSKFSCTLCGITILTTGKKAHYKVHVKRILAELKSRPTSYGSEVICPICQHSFNSAKGLKRHLQRHDMNDIVDANVGANVFCRICKKHFASSALLKVHVENCHLLELSCEYCDEMFAAKRNLRKHIRRVHKELFIAENKKNSDQAGGSNGMDQDGSNVGMDQASGSNVGMDQASGSHVDSIEPNIVKKELKNCDDHDLSKSHPCQQCDQSFQEASALKLHTVDIHQKPALGLEALRDDLSHGKLDTIKSVELMKTYSTSQVQNDLEGESSSSAKGNFVKCSVCLKAVSAVEYYDHLSGLHNWTADTIFTCSFCQVRFPYKYLLNEHKIQCTSNFQCKLCDKKNFVSQNLRTHVIYFHKYDWNSYISKFTVPIIAIDDGGLEISDLDVGLRPQSSLKVCGLCGAGYTQLSEYTIHIQTHMKKCYIKLHALEQPEQIRENTSHGPPSAEAQTSEQGLASALDSVPAAAAVEILPSEHHCNLGQCQGPADTTPVLMNKCHPEVGVDTYIDSQKAELNYVITNEISTHGDVAEALDENSLETVAPSFWDSESTNTEDNIASSFITESPDSQETVAPSLITESPDSQETVAPSFLDSESPCSKDNIAPLLLTESPDTPEYVAPSVCNPACPNPQEEIVTVAEEKAPSKKREMCSENPLPSKKQKLLSNGHRDYQWDDLPELVFKKQHAHTPGPKNDLELPELAFKKQHADTPGPKNDLELPELVCKKQHADTSLLDSSPDIDFLSGTCDPQTRNVFQVFTEGGATNRDGATNRGGATNRVKQVEDIQTKALQGDQSTVGENVVNNNSHKSMATCKQKRNVFDSIHI